MREQQVQHVSAALLVCGEEVHVEAGHVEGMAHVGGGPEPYQPPLLLLQLEDRLLTGHRRQRPARKHTDACSSSCLRAEQLGAAISTLQAAGDAGAHSRGGAWQRAMCAVQYICRRWLGG